MHRIVARIAAPGRTAVPAWRAAQVRLSTNSRGGTYHAPGIRAAAQTLPMSEGMEEQFNQLAKTAHQTQNLRDAMTLYERVLSIRREKHGQDSVECAPTLHNIGRVFIDLKNPRSAEMALIEACALYNQHEESSLRYADSLGLLALCYRDMKAFSEAETTFKEALKIYRDTVYNHRDHTWLPTDKQPPAQPNLHPLSTVAHLLADASLLFLYQNQSDRAAAFLEDALEIRRFLYSHNNTFKPMIAQTLSKLSEVKRSKGDIEEAWATIEECCDICIETLGRDAPATAAAISSKGNTLSVQQKYREALKCYEEAATTYGLAFGKSSPLVGSEMIHIGRMQEMLKDFAGAEKSYNKAKEVTEQSLGEDHIQMAEADAFLAALFVVRQEHEKAIPLLRNAIRIRTRVDRNDPALAFVYHRLGEALAASRDVEAEAHYLMSIELHRQNKTDSQRLLLTDCLDDLGLHYLSHHHHDKAEECFKEALDERLSVFGEKHPTIAYSYSNMALLLQAKDDFVGAIKSAQQSAAMYDSCTGDHDLARCDVMATRGQCHHSLKQLGEAKDIHEKVLNTRRIKGEVAQFSLAETMHDLCRVLLDQGEPAAAGQHLSQAFVIIDRYPQHTQNLRDKFVKTRDSFPDAEQLAR
jgi:tetratricopeptide (TPR) repeat protein